MRGTWHPCTIIVVAVVLLHDVASAEESHGASLMGFLRRAYGATRSDLTDVEKLKRKESRRSVLPFYFHEGGDYSARTFVFPLFYRRDNRAERYYHFCFLPLLSGCSRLEDTGRLFYSAPLLSFGGTMTNNDGTLVMSLPLLTGVFWNTPPDGEEATYAMCFPPILRVREREYSRSRNENLFGLSPPARKSGIKYSLDASAVWFLFRRATVRDRTNGQLLQSMASIGPLSAICRWKRSDEVSETFFLFSRFGRGTDTSSEKTLTEQFRMGIADQVVTSEKESGSPARRKIAIVPVWAYEDDGKRHDDAPVGLVFDRSWGGRKGHTTLGLGGPIFKHEWTPRAREISLGWKAVSLRRTSRDTYRKLLWGLLFSQDSRHRSMSLTPLFTVRSLGDRRLFLLAGLPVFRTGSIGSVGDERLDREIKNLVHHRKRRRCQAADQLGHYRDRRAAPFLIDALLDPSENVRGRAVAALATINDPDAIPHVIALLEEGTCRDREHAARALGRLGSEAALPALERAKRDRSSFVRKAAQKAIEAIRTTRERTGAVPSGGER